MQMTDDSTKATEEAIQSTSLSQNIYHPLVMGIHIFYVLYLLELARLL